MKCQKRASGDVEMRKAPKSSQVFGGGFFSVAEGKREFVDETMRKSRFCLLPTVDVSARSENHLVNNELTQLESSTFSFSRPWKLYPFMNVNFDFLLSTANEAKQDEK